MKYVLDTWAKLANRFWPWEKEERDGVIHVCWVGGVATLSYEGALRSIKGLFKGVFLDSDCSEARKNPKLQVL